MSGLLFLCTELTLFCIELPENYIYLNHSELGNFLMYIINDVNTVLALKKHLISFLDLKELSSKYGLGDFDVELHRMAPKSGSLKSVSGEKIFTVHSELRQNNTNMQKKGCKSHCPHRLLQSRLFVLCVRTSIDMTFEMTVG